MSNECFCNIKVTGTKDDVTRFMEEVRSESEALDFGKVVPYSKFEAAHDEIRYKLWDEFIKHLDIDLGGPDEQWEKVYAEFDELLEKAWAEFDERLEKDPENAFPEYINRSKYGSGDWRVEHWGTKWNVEDVGYGFDDNEDGSMSAGYSFFTAWDPPLVIIEKMAEKYPFLDFEFTYSEPGMDFQGGVSYKNGEKVNEFSGPYGEEDDEDDDDDLEQVRDSLTGKQESGNREAGRQQIGQKFKKL